MQVSEKELKEFILDSGLVSRKDVEAATEEGEKRKQSVGDILVSNGSHFRRTPPHQGVRARDPVREPQRQEGAA